MKKPTKITKYGKVKKSKGYSIVRYVSFDGGQSARKSTIKKGLTFQEAEEEIYKLERK